MLDCENIDLNELKSDMIIKISFIQHERFMHLIVLVLFSLLLFISLIAFFISGNFGMLSASILMLILLIPYIIHYYFLENSVHKLYYLYDEVIIKKKNK